MYGFGNGYNNTAKMNVTLKSFIYPACGIVFNGYYPLIATKEIRTTNECCPYLNGSIAVVYAGC